MKPIAAAMTAAIALTAAGCSVQGPPRQDGVVIVTGTTPAPAASPVTIAGAATVMPPPPAAPTIVEAAIPSPAELADLAVERDVGVLIAAEKARDPFHTAAVDFSAVDEVPTAG